MKQIFLLMTFFGLAFIANAQTTRKPKPKTTPTPVEKPVRIVSYEILENGDTINRLDNLNRKQGYWLIKQNGGYGEEGSIEFGQFDQNKKVGEWKQYTSKGVIVAIENFKKGNQDAEAKYFEDGKLYCIGHFLALKSNQTFDTIMVEDPVTNIESPVVIKSDVGSIRHGLWTFYDIETSRISKIVEYQADEVVYEKEFLTEKDTAYLKKKWSVLPSSSNEDSEVEWYLDRKKAAIKHADLPKPSLEKRRKEKE